MPPKKPRKALDDALAAEFVYGQAQPEIEVIEEVEKPKQESTMPLDQIQDRASGDTRPLNQGHVEELAESIAVLGLIEPLVVDQKGRLLAGGHRQAAISWLKEREPDKYEKHFPGNLVPVRILPFDAEQDPDSALQIEIAENEKRRDYTKEEVRAIADRLKAAGYHDQKGRPAKGSKPLQPALEIIVGKSIRTLRRYLSDEPVEKNGTDDRFISLRRSLPHLKRFLEIEPQTKKEEDLSKKLAGVIKLIEAVIEKP